MSLRVGYSLGSYGCYRVYSIDSRVLLTLIAVSESFAVHVVGMSDLRQLDLQAHVIPSHGVSSTNEQ